MGAARGEEVTGSPGVYSLSPVADIRRTTGQLPQTHPKKILRLFLGAPGEALKMR